MAKKFNVFVDAPGCESENLSPVGPKRHPEKRGSKQVTVQIEPALYTFMLQLRADASARGERYMLKDQIHDALLMFLKAKGKL